VTASQQKYKKPLDIPLGIVGDQVYSFLLSHLDNEKPITCEGQGQDGRWTGQELDRAGAGQDRSWTGHELYKAGARQDRSWTGQELDRTGAGQDRRWTGQELDRVGTEQDRRGSKFY
jgi:hypothetical protein